MRNGTTNLAGQRGALLLEASLALLLFAVGLLLLVRASCYAAQADARRRCAARAEQALLSKLEQLRARPFADLVSGSDQLCPAPGLVLRRSWTCEALWPGFVWIEVKVTSNPGRLSYRSSTGRRR